MRCKKALRCEKYAVGVGTKWYLCGLQSFKLLNHTLGDFRFEKVLKEMAPGLLILSHLDLFFLLLERFLPLLQGVVLAFVALLSGPRNQRPYSQTIFRKLNYDFVTFKA